MQKTLEEAVSNGLPGVSAAIGNRRGVIWRGVAGFSDVKARLPIVEENVFGVGSITKVFVAVVVLQLVQEGKLSLDATPTSLLGEVATQGIANASLSTVGELLAHSGGIPSWEDDAAWILRGRGRDNDPCHVWGKTEALDFIRGPTHPALNSPGVAFNYSNSGFTILGLILERVTGRSATDEIRRRIISPLGLEHTYLEGFEPHAKGVLPRRYQYATPIFRKTAGVSPAFPEVRPNLIDVSASNLSVEWTAGGIVSSPTDLIRFAIALRDGWLLDEKRTGYLQAWTPARSNADMGHGLFQIKTNIGLLPGHNGSVLGFTGSFWWAEEGDLAVVVLANVGTMHAGETPPAASDVALRSNFPELAWAYAEAAANIQSMS